MDPCRPKAHSYMRRIPKCHYDFVASIQGSEKSAQFSDNIHAGTTKIFKDLHTVDDEILWEVPGEERAPWPARWNGRIWKWPDPAFLLSDFLP